MSLEAGSWTTIVGSYVHNSRLAADGINIPVKGDWLNIPFGVREWIRDQIDLCKPARLNILNGSIEEDHTIKMHLVEKGVLIPLPKYDNCFLARTDPKDVARVESRTVISTPEKDETIPEPADGVKGTLGHWMSPGDLDAAIKERFPGCMNGITISIINL